MIVTPLGVFLSPPFDITLFAMGVSCGRVFIRLSGSAGEYRAEFGEFFRVEIVRVVRACFFVREVVECADIAAVLVDVRVECVSFIITYRSVQVVWAFYDAFQVVELCLRARVYVHCGHRWVCAGAQRDTYNTA